MSFDDQWIDSWYAARPMFTAHGVHATFFVSRYYLFSDAGKRAGNKHDAAREHRNNPGAPRSLLHEQRVCRLDHFASTLPPGGVQRLSWVLFPAHGISFPQPSGAPDGPTGEAALYRTVQYCDETGQSPRAD